MARLMIVAGGAFQCPIARLAKEQGHFVICSNLYEDSPAFAYADVCEVANVLDKERNLEIARRHRPDAVLTDQTDISVPTVAYVSEQLGLKGIGVDVAKRFHNKHTMREFTSKVGFATPRFELCHTVEEAQAFLRDTPEAIIKPIDSQSSRGIHIVRSADDVARSFADCIQYSNEEKAILIEEYIEGTEFTVDGLKTTNECIVTAISEKRHFAHNANIASRLLFTNDNDRFDYDALRKVNVDMVEAMGLPFGLTHAEYKCRDGQFYLIEIAARGGGTMISSDVVPLISGINSNKVFLNTLVGGSEEIVVEKHHSHVVLGFFDIAPGIVEAIEGLDEARGLPGVQLVHLDVAVGDRVGKAQDDRSRCGYYVIYADSADEMEARERALKDAVRVTTA